MATAALSVLVHIDPCCVFGLDCNKFLICSCPSCCLRLDQKTLDWSRYHLLSKQQLRAVLGCLTNTDRYSHNSATTACPTYPKHHLTITTRLTHKLSSPPVPTPFYTASTLTPSTPKASLPTPSTCSNNVPTSLPTNFVCTFCHSLLTVPFHNTLV
jgi:hypothetical protein